MMTIVESLPTPAPAASGVNLAPASSAATFAEIGAVLRDPARRRFLVLSHLRPDGDALGCQLAFGLVLRALGKEVTIWNEDGMLDKLRFLPGAELVNAPPLGQGEMLHDFDVLVALDTAAHPRLGTPLQAIGRIGLTINLDHHISNPGYGDLAYIDGSSPATGQVLYDFFHDQKFPITADVAANLFVAISTDTGSFQYPNTTAHTYEVAAALIRTGIDHAELSRLLYGSYPRRRLLLLQELLHTLQWGSDGRVAAFALTLEATVRIGVTPEDNEGLIDYIRAIDTVLVAVFFEEMATPAGLIRLSMRSNTPAVDVSAICQQFGGGGHRLAAGARVRGTLAEVEKRVLATIHEALPVVVPTTSPAPAAPAH
ncbi:MAG: bifunctional oligoribonuclease/PAP phosphatase NrnA [Verrucomicrobia bacterium]|nr:bifunctional oligoribonuclease/PAP phosphatase NrnA [Verrucomicrobiota bacterium]